MREDLLLRMQYVMGRLRRIFFMSLPENEQDYNKSRNLYIISDTASQMLSGFSGGVFLVSLMSYVGLSDGNIGILLSIGGLSSFLQLVTMKTMQQMHKYKLLVTIASLQKVWLAFIYFIPLLALPDSLGKIILILCYFCASTCINLGSPATSDWVATLVPFGIRGTFFAKKEAIATFSVMSVSLIMGLMLDYFKGERLVYGFIVTGAVIFILAVINVTALILMKEPKTGLLNEDGKELHGSLAKRKLKSMERDKSQNTWKEVKAAFENKQFVKVLILNCLWMTGFSVAIPFNYSYQLGELNLSYTYIMVAGFLASMARVLITPKVGKRADHIGMARILERGMFLVAVHYIIMTLAKPGNGYLTYTLSTFFSTCAWAYTGVGFLGIQLEFFDEQKRIIQFSLLSAVSGIYGFFVSFFTGNLLDALQKSVLLQQHGIYAQQVTNFLGVIVVIGTIFYIKKVLEPLENVEG